MYEGEPTRLFIYHDLRTAARRAKVGEYICRWPPHITIAIINTEHTDHALNVIADLASRTAQPRVARGSLIRCGGYQRKPAIRIDDPHEELQTFQSQLYAELGNLAYTTYEQPYYFGDSYRPHVTIHHLHDEPYPVPQSFSLDEITVVHNRLLNTMHQRGRVIAAIPFAEVEGGATFDAQARMCCHR